VTEIERLKGEILCLRREIAAGKAGRTKVSRDWLREARVEMRRLCARLRIHQGQHELAQAYLRRIG